MPPRILLAEAARTLTPLRQGSLDSLCGLYALINAVRLLLYPVQPPHHRLVELFDVGLAELQRCRATGNGITLGIDEAEWLQVAAAVVTRANELFATDIKLKPIPVAPEREPAAVIDAIKASARRGNPAVVALDGHLDHWSVVARFTATRLILFDSWGSQWVTVASIGLAHGRGRHVIPSGGVITLRLG
jgi:hypothetical protein